MIILKINNNRVTVFKTGPIVHSMGWTNLTPHELVRVGNRAYGRIPSRIRKIFER
jgi:hypothetical protein